MESITETILSGYFGGAGGDRNDNHLNKACVLRALQPLIPANRNKRNKMTTSWSRTFEGEI